MRKTGGLARDLFWASFALAAAAAALTALRTLECYPVLDGAPLVLADARFTTATPNTPPGGTAAWTEVALPHTLRHVDPPAAGGWYELHFHLGEVPDPPHAALLPHLRLNAEVWLNGWRLGDPSSMESPITRRFNEPRLLTLPHHALRAGENRLAVHLVTEPAGFGSLGKIYVAPRALLVPAHERLTFWKVTLPLLVLPLMAGMALLFVALWWRRREPAYGWFVLVVLAWTVETLDFCVSDPPVPARIWDWILFVSVGWMSVVWVFFAHRFTNTRWPALERVVLAYGALYSLAVFIPDHRVLWLLAINVCNLVNGLCCLYGSFRFYQAARRGQPDTYLLWVVTLAGYVFAAFDSLVIGQAWIGSESRYLYLASPLLLAAIARSLIVRFIRALGEAESLNRELETRVAAKTREIEKQQESLRALEVEQRLLAERSRIMFDMHDGVGGQLVATLAAARQGTIGLDEVADNLGATLDDLRLVIDSLDPGSTTLPALLGTLRSRVERMVEPLGMTLYWPAAAELDRLPPLQQEQVLQVARVIQEAAANAIKHARATVLSFSAGLARVGDAGCVYFEVADNGVGLQEPAEPRPSKGRGLVSMQDRARRLGGTLEIDSGPGGTRVRLLMPAA